MHRTTKTLLTWLLAVGALVGSVTAMFWQPSGSLRRGTLLAFVIGLLALGAIVLVDQAIRAAYRGKLIVALLSRWLNGRSERLERALREGTCFRTPVLRDPGSRTDLDRRVPDGVVSPDLAVVRAQTHNEDQVVVSTMSVFAPRGGDVDCQRLESEFVRLSEKTFIAGPVAHQYVVVGSGECERILALSFDSVYVCRSIDAASFFIVRDHHGVPIITAHDGELEARRQVAFELGLSFERRPLWPST